MTFNTADIGPVFDVGISLRGNTTLTVKNQKGNNVVLSKVAFMTDPQAVQEETTDLQRKQQLTQLSSSNIVDREFTEWPQVSQGDWGGGELQRVYSETDRYYGGRGLLWPLSSRVPAEPFIGASYSEAGWTGAGVYFTSVVSGMTRAGTPGYAFAYRPSAGTTSLVFISSFDGTRTADNSVASQSADGTIEFGGGYVWFVGQPAGNPKLYGWFPSLGPVLIQDFGPNVQLPVTAIKFGVVGKNAYVATALSNSGVTQGGDIVHVTQVTKDAGTNAPIGLADITFTLPTNLSVQSMTFVNDQLIMAVTDGGGVVQFIGFDIPSQTSYNIGRIVGYQQVKMEYVAGAVFIVALTAPIGTFIKTCAIDMYLLIGNSVQFVGTVPPHLFGTPSKANPLATIFPRGIASAVSAYDPYAIFGVVFQPSAAPVMPVDIVADTSYMLAVMAYDVQKGALFTVSKDFPLTTLAGSAVIGPGLCVVGSQPTSVGGPSAQWGVVVRTDAPRFTPGFFGIAPVTTPQVAVRPVVAPGRILSSMIDFTSASVKLFRRVVVDHLPINAGCGFYMAVWLDQDPDSLNPTPDYAVANAVGGSTRTSLVINKTAKKIVYLLEYYSPVIVANLGVDAPRPIAVAIQAATGWVQKLQLMLVDEAGTNNQGPNQFCFAVQQDTAMGADLDAFAAYSFLRKIWRELGSECVLTLPNGDSYNAAIESEAFRSPKPFGVSFSGDQPNKYSSVLELLTREDI